MEEELISFDTAKLAKKKGFKWVTDNKLYYNDNGYLNILHFSEEDIPAPTQNLLQKWLRETHNLIVVSLPYTASIENIEPCYIWMIYKKQASTATENSIFKTYEEALEFALQEALKLI